MWNSHPGLCAGCAWTRKVESGKGSTFWMCRRAKTDPRFRKYPTLPVLRCAGFEPAEASNGPAQGGADEDGEL